MPIVLILFGLLGGAMAFGFIGVFIGPTLLAVGFTLVKEWFVSTPTPSQGPETEHHFGAAPLYQTSH